MAGAPFPELRATAPRSRVACPATPDPAPPGSRTSYQTPFPLGSLCSFYRENNSTEMHREPTKRKLPLSTRISPRAARSAPGSQSTARRPLPGQGADVASARVWKRRPEADCAGSGHGGPERRPLTAARGPGSGRLPGRERVTHRSGRAGRPHPGAPAARQDGPGRRSHREGESASPPVPCRPLQLPERAHSRFLQTELGDPSSAGCPRQAPTPFPSHLPLFTLFPSPLPPTPTKWKIPPGAGGGGGTPL